MFTSILASLREPRARHTASLSGPQRWLEPALKVFQQLILLAFLISMLTALSCNANSPNQPVSSRCFSLSNAQTFTFAQTGSSLETRTTLTTACANGGPAWKVVAVTSGQQPDGTASGSQIAWLTISPAQGQFHQKGETQNLTFILSPSSPPLPQTKGDYHLQIFVYDEPGNMLDYSYPAKVSIN